MYSKYSAKFQFFLIPYSIINFLLVKTFFYKSANDNINNTYNDDNNRNYKNRILHNTDKNINQCKKTITNQHPHMKKNKKTPWLCSSIDALIFEAI